MGKISVIDGTSNAGKTTICENLKGRAKNVFIIPEARLFIEMYNIRKLNIPSIPKNAEEEKKNQKFFFELELKKIKLLIKKIKTTFLLAFFFII